MMAWEDGDAPPDLVDAGIVVEADEKPTKVPITIVTGADLGALSTVCGTC